MWLAPDVWAVLPKEMARRRGPVRCIGSLISQGINAQQAVANDVGTNALMHPSARPWRAGFLARFLRHGPGDGCYIP